jgi:hypothetical protein
MQVEHSTGPGWCRAPPWSSDRLPRRFRLAGYLLTLMAADLALAGWQFSHSHPEPRQRLRDRVGGISLPVRGELVTISVSIGVAVLGRDGFELLNCSPRPTLRWTGQEGGLGPGAHAAAGGVPVRPLTLSP